MKKILSLIAAGALALGLIGCSGDLHDDVKVDPNAMTGYWSYRVLDTEGNTEINMIVNKTGAGQSGAFGSPDFAVDVSSGTAAIIWDGKDGTDLSLSTRTDCPSLADVDVTLADGEACVFVFCPFATANLYCYATAGLDDGNWPGVETTATVTVAKWSFNVVRIELVNCPAIGAAGYIGICEAWVPGNEWNETTPNKITDADNAVLVLSAPYKAEAEGEADISLDLQILNPVSDAKFWGDDDDPSKISNGDKVTATAKKADCNGKTMKLVVTFTSDNECTAAFVPAVS